MEVIEREITARERAAGSSCQVPKRTLREQPHMATTLISGGSITPKCSYCHQAYTSNSCKTVIDAAERKHILRRSGRCFVCLRKNHLSRDCRSTIKCTKCNGRHHVSICGGRQTSSDANPTHSRNDSDQTSQGLMPPTQTKLPTNPKQTTPTQQCVVLG